MLKSTDDRSRADEAFQRRVGAMTEATLAGYRHSLDSHMPPCPFRELAQWAMTDDHPGHHRFAQINAISQLVKMTTILLSPVVAAEDGWPGVLLAAGTMNAWQVHEVFSDNLAIGLGFPAEYDDDAMSRRRALLRRFNDEVLESLASSPPTKTRDELNEIFHPFNEQVSIFQQSLIADKHRELARSFATQRTDLNEDMIEHCMAPILTANILSCGEVVSFIEHAELKELVRRWLGYRYSSVNTLMSVQSIDAPELLDHGGKTILVVPTLGYYVYALAKANGVLDKITPELVSGPLAQALRSSAILVRLLNDLGTHLMVATAEERRSVLAELVADIKSDNAEVFVSELAKLDSPKLTRFTKDASFREINLGFHGLAHKATTAGLLDKFCARIEFYATAYREHRDNMLKNIEQVTQHVGDPRCGEIIASFVEFHELLYQQHYHQDDGEYAI